MPIWSNLCFSFKRRRFCAHMHCENQFWSPSPLGALHAHATNFAMRYIPPWTNKIHRWSGDGHGRTSHALDEDLVYLWGSPNFSVLAEKGGWASESGEPQVLHFCIFIDILEVFRRGGLTLQFTTPIRPGLMQNHIVTILLTSRGWVFPASHETNDQLRRVWHNAVTQIHCVRDMLWPLVDSQTHGFSSHNTEVLKCDCKNARPPWNNSEVYTVSGWVTWLR